MKKCISVPGMHCKSCEIILESKLKELPGVHNIQADSKKQEIILEVDAHFQEDVLFQEINTLGYGDKTQKNTGIDYLLFGIVFITLYLMIYIFGDMFSFTSLFQSNQHHLFGIFILGIIASLSSCLAVTGGVIIGLSQKISPLSTKWEIFKIHAGFHMGRLVAYFLGGGLLGYFGSQLESIVVINKVLLLITGVFMILLGLQMMKIIPESTSFHIIPKSLSRKIVTSSSHKFSFFIGASTFLLPCGFTQSVQILAMSSGNFLQGAKMLSVFALGTLPVLFALGFGFSYIKNFSITLLQKIIGVGVVSFGIYILVGFSQLIHIGNLGFSESNTSQSHEILEEQKTLHIGHNGSQLEPQKIVLSGAKKYEVNILPSQDGFGCLFDMTIPGLDDNAYKIKKGKNIQIHIDGTKKGIYKVVCTSMGMLHGTIEIK